MRRVLPTLSRALALGGLLGLGSARADCCDPPLTATSYRATGYTTTRTLVPTAYVAPTIIEPTVYVESPVTYAPTRYIVESERSPGLLERVFGGPGRTTTRSYYDLTPTSYVETLPVVVEPTTYVSETRFVPTSAVLVDPCALPTSIVRAQPQNATKTAPYGAAPRALDGTGAGVNQGGTSGEPAFDRQTPQGGSSIDDPQVPLLDGGTSRTSLRPVITEMRAQSDNPVAGALRGVVVDSDGRPKANLHVVFSDVRQTYRDRDRVTDANGRFEAVLPNGDWTVNVQESDGRLTPFGTVTASNGRFLDDRDRVVSSLRLNH